MGTLYLLGLKQCFLLWVKKSLFWTWPIRCWIPQRVVIFSFFLPHFAKEPMDFYWCPCDKDKCRKILKIFWEYFKINNHLNGQMCLLLGRRHLCICETTMSRSCHLVYYKVTRLVPYSRSCECIESCLPTILIITKTSKRFNAHLAVIKVVFCSSKR